MIAVDQNAFAVAPVRLLSSERVCGGLPANIAVIGVRTDKYALAAECVNAVAVDRWRAAWTVAPTIGEQLTDLRRPFLLPACDVQGDQELGVIASPHRIDGVADHGHPRISQAAGARHPDLFWPVFRPCPQETCLSRNVGSLRALPLGPVFPPNRGDVQ